MGNGASSGQSKNAGNGRFGIINKKTQAISTFGKYISYEDLSKYSREELIDFLRFQRQNRQNLDNDLDREETSVDRFRIRPKTACLRRSTMESKKADWRKVQVKVESDAACFLCDGMINFLSSGFPCRVCTRIFHQRCLEMYEGCRPGDLAMTERAHCLTGWSCYRCGDLTNLLTDDELRQMIDEFDGLDLDRDASISKEEYLRYKASAYARLEGKPIPDVELRRHRMIFHVMDADGSGALDWWEFVNHECTRVLAKRKQEDLANLLTEKESVRLKERFDAMDDNGDGVITEYEARTAYRRWFVSAGGIMARSSAVFGDSMELLAHVEEGSRFFEEADADKSGVVSWPEFKQNQALYVISNRPNVRFPKEPLDT